MSKKPRSIEDQMTDLEKHKPKHHSELPVEMRCPDCKGKGERDCETCEGYGTVIED